MTWLKYCFHFTKQGSTDRVVKISWFSALELAAAKDWAAYVFPEQWTLSYIYLSNKKTRAYDIN